MSVRWSGFSSVTPHLFYIYYITILVILHFVIKCISGVVTSINVLLHNELNINCFFLKSSGQFFALVSDNRK